MTIKPNIIDKWYVKIEKGEEKYLDVGFSDSQDVEFQNWIFMQRRYMFVTTGEIKPTLNRIDFTEKIF